MNDVGFASGADIRHPNIYRIISGWYNTREDHLRLLNATLSGPSSTAGTDLNLNKHLWPQGGVRVRQMIKNPTNVPIAVEIWKMNLKCSDPGSVAGVYVEGTLPFAVGSAQVYENRPDSTYWDFFNQTSRQLMSASSAYMKLQDDEQMSTNVPGVYHAPWGSTTKWEREPGPNNSSMTGLHAAPLSWIFPGIRKKLTYRCVFRGVVPAFGHRVYSYMASFPSEMRPRDIITNDCMNFSKHSYFLFCKARSVQLGIAELKAPGGVPKGTVNQYMRPWYRPLAQLVFAEYRHIKLRAAGDAFPTFAVADAKGTAAGGGWLGNSYGLTPIEAGNVYDATSASTMSVAGQKKLHYQHVASGPFYTVNADTGIIQP